GCLQGLAAPDQSACRRGRQGRRLPGDWRRTGKRGREGHAHRDFERAQTGGMIGRAGACREGTAGRQVVIEAIIIWLIIGSVAGWAAGQVIKGHGFGLVGNIIVGIIGAVVAGWLLPLIGLVIGGGIIGAIINAIIGAVIALFVIGLLKK